MDVLIVFLGSCSSIFFLLPFVNEPFFDATRNLSEVTPLEMMNIFN